jgi:hypothetical protein
MSLLMVLFGWVLVSAFGSIVIARFMRSAAPVAPLPVPARRPVSAIR